MRKIYFLPSAALALCITALCVSGVNADDKKEKPSALDSAEKKFLDKDNTPDTARDFQSDSARSMPTTG